MAVAATAVLPTASGAETAIAMANRTSERRSRGIKGRNRQQLSLALASMTDGIDAESAWYSMNPINKAPHVGAPLHRLRRSTPQTKDCRSGVGGFTHRSLRLRDDVRAASSSSSSVCRIVGAPPSCAPALVIPGRTLLEGEGRVGSQASPQLQITPSE